MAVIEASDAKIAQIILIWDAKEVADSAAMAQLGSAMAWLSSASQVLGSEASSPDRLLGQIWLSSA
jgi:hypothetical protein